MIAPTLFENIEVNLENRVAALEIALAHLQRDYDNLNAVVTEQSKLIDRVERQNRALVDRVTSLAGALRDAAPRRLEDDRPPHY